MFNSRYDGGEIVLDVKFTREDLEEVICDCERAATDLNIEALLAHTYDAGVDTITQMEDDARVSIEDCVARRIEAMGTLPDDAWYDRANGEWVYDRAEPTSHRDKGEGEDWYGSKCMFSKPYGEPDPQERCCNTCDYCGTHMCENHTVRCSGCGAVVCGWDSERTPDGEWKCHECAGPRPQEPERAELLEAIERYRHTRQYAASTEIRSAVDLLNALL